MEKQIGEAAGKVWQALHKSPMTVTRLSSVAALSAMLTAQAIGWLAREGKITSEDTSKGVVLKLKG